MTQIATVLRLVGHNKAEVMVCRQSACGHHCASCGACTTEDAAQITVLAENPLGAEAGDLVRVESKSSQVLGIAAAVYLLPFLCLFAGYLIASDLLNWAEGAAVAIGILFMAISFVAAWRLDRRVRTDRPVQFRILEVMKSCSDM